MTRAQAKYHLEPLGGEDVARWDELIAPYETCELFHQTPWLAYLSATKGVTIRYWSIQECGHTVGYFCGGQLRKGPFRILGSPLRGWGTNFMGPIANGDLDSAAFLMALDAVVRKERLAMLELEGRALSGDAMAEAGYVDEKTETFVVPILPNGEDSMWRNLDGTRRTGIRKALKNNLTVEETDDPSIADQFYDDYLEIMHRKGLHPPFPRSHPQLLFQILRKAGQIIALRVHDPHDALLATGFFPHDQKSMYFWGGASRGTSSEVAANELLHWNAICLAARKGIIAYNMSGNGLFKKKFGGMPVELRRWHRCYSVTSRLARRAYGYMFTQRLRIQATLAAHLYNVAPKRECP